MVIKEISDFDFVTPNFSKFFWFTKTFLIIEITVYKNEPSRDELNNQTRPFGFGLNQFDLRRK
ncbi:hypothetical protein BpHYR1_023662 [Brachionus plicatilis]|uniref:Uncharacterized protein n=1 Tax=Brachionus plicatilis TaxID=10195 RepID=A0A3M7STK3_BRAPC|nr:hypothetical protein BpHYR1_023662 [Brachionus plicatilis]